MSHIKVLNMSMNFNHVPILNNLNFQIKEGEFVGIIGPSGCGKSTLLSLIAGLLKPSSGEVHNKFTNQSSSFVFQEASLMPWKTIGENIALPLHLLGEKKDAIDNKVSEQMERFKISSAKNLYPRQVSGGMKMRASLARALISNPKLLLLDEPFSGLDTILEEKFCDDLLDLWKQQNTTSILISHNIQTAVYLCQKIILLSKNPTEILDIIEIDWETQKEKSKNYRDSALFHSTCKKIKSILEKTIHE